VSEKLHILILEDDPERIQIFRRKIRGVNFQIDYAETAEEAIRLWEARNYDVVFLDHDLGGECYVDTSHKNTGSEVVRWAITRQQTFPLDQPYIIIHSLNTPAAQDMEDRLKRDGFENVHRIPFTNLMRDYLDDPSFLSC
jgi:CheY-like chemotaxis protein